MANPAKAKGSLWERAVAAYLVERGFPGVERRYGAGRRYDTGDLTGIQAVIECKSLKTITLAKIMDEVALEKANAKMDLGIAVIKRRQRPAAHAYAVLTLEDLASLLKAADY